MTSPESSFRDPAGRLVARDDGRIVRAITDARAAVDLVALLATPFARAAIEAGRLVRTRVAPDDLVPALAPTADAHAHLVLEHERVDFVSYPYEWPPEMLFAAARLTLELAEGALAEGFGLKDATPYNVLFAGARPVFVDVSSFERRDAHDPMWLAEAQFARGFLLPLLAARRLGLPLSRSLTTTREGLAPEEVARLAGPFRRLVPPFLGLAAAPSWLGGAATAATTATATASPAPRRLQNPAQARFVIEALFRRAGRTLARLRPPADKASAWSRYDEDDAADLGRAAKRRFVAETLAELRPARVLDLGCNVGRHAILAARAGAQVVAVDADPDVVGVLHGAAADAGHSILPLVIDIARPSPALGWRNREHAGFLERARGRFDLVLALALVHHLLVTERAPLAEIVALLADLTRRFAVVEWVNPEDARFRELARGRDALHAGQDATAFEAACGAAFTIVRRAPLPGGTRVVYLLEKRP